MEQQTNCPKCGNKFATQAGGKSICPKCLFEFAMEPTNANNPSVNDEPIFPEGTLIDAYKIINLIGRGGMGTVYKAHQASLDRVVALKVLPAGLSGDEDFRKRFNREAKMLASLSHPNIVTIHDMGQYNEHYYFVMEFVEGVTARELIAQGKLPPQEALKIVPQLCDALEYAHSENIVHRDIKPENILIDKKGRVKIADFGLARIIQGDLSVESITKTQDVMGTYDYMAPEQRASAKAVDHRADIYSLGVVFYEMLTGELPIGRFELPSRKVQIDVRVDDVVMKSLEQEPSKRYQRASEVGTAVTEILSGTAQIPKPVERSQHITEKGIMALILSLIPTGVTQIAAIILGVKVRNDAKQDKKLSDALYLSTTAIGISVLWLIFGILLGAINVGTVVGGIFILLVCWLIYSLRYKPRYSYPTVKPQSSGQYSGLAITSLVVGFIPLVITQVLGIIFGIMAIRRINRSGGVLKGTGLAIAGIIVSVVMFFPLFMMAAAIIIPNVLSSGSVTVVGPNTGVYPQHNSIEILQKLALANEIYRRADLDENYRNDYAPSVKALMENSLLKKAIFNTPVHVAAKGNYKYNTLIKSGGGSYSRVEGDELIARADQGTLGINARPYNGYFYRSIPTAYGGFAFAAYPVVTDQGNSDNKTYVVDKRGIIYSKQLGNLKYPNKWDLKTDPTKDGWRVETRVEISEELIEGVYQQIRKLQPDWPEQLSAREAEVKMGDPQVREEKKKQLAQSLKITRRITDEFKQGQTIADISIKYADIGEYAKAIAIAGSITNDLWKGRALQEITKGYVRSGQKSVDILNQALEVARTIKDEVKQSRTIAVISINCAEIGEYAKAIAIAGSITDDSWKDKALQEISNVKIKHK